ncbi:TPA: hypothetical protein MDP65_003112 [Citrobacter freundii]|nr:hypothetical protein [Citrobacter freundii]
MRDLLGHIQQAMKNVNDILFPFAKGVLYRESGVLNSYTSAYDIFGRFGEGNLKRGHYDFIKKFRD